MGFEHSEKAHSQIEEAEAYQEESAEKDITAVELKRTESNLESRELAEIRMQ